MAFNNKKYMKEYYEKNKEELREYHKEYYKKNKEELREYQKKNKDRRNKQAVERQKNHKKLGLCIICNKPKHKRLVMCLAHQRYYLGKRNEYNIKHSNRIREKNVRARKLYKETGRCTSCGHTLNPDMDNGRVQCLNCREEIHTPRRQHGNIIF